MYIWEEVNQQSYKDPNPSIQHYSDQLVTEVDILLEDVSPETFMLKVRKLHSIIQKSQLLMFYLKHLHIFEDTEGEEWIAIIEKDYYEIFYDKRCSFSKKLKDSILFQIEGPDSSFTNEFVWEKSIEHELSNYLNLNQKAVMDRYQPLILKFNNLKGEFNEILESVRPDNFFECYSQLVYIDIHCLYILDSLFLLGDLSIENYLVLTESDFPFYKNDLLKAIDYIPELKQ